MQNILPTFFRILNIESVVAEMSEAYKRAGVDIDAGNEAVNRMKQHVTKTFRKEVRTGLGGFGSLFALENKYKKPVLVSGTDGVGTKLKIAFEMKIDNTIGIDLVAMCVNDVIVQGAEPLFFLDYIATGKLLPEQIEKIVEGISEGCIQAGCSLVGGETAEMPGLYNHGDYDVAGFAVGVVEEDKIVDGSNIEDGDIIIGLNSSGLHSNGFSLVRYLFFEKNHYNINDYILELNSRLGEELLKPTRIYAKTVLELLEKFSIKGMAHITGGGLIENIPRILPENLQAEIKLNSWNIPPIFSLLRSLGDLENNDLYRTFNMGIGYILIVSKNDKDSILNKLQQLGEEAAVIGSITRGNKGVLLRDN